jgi:hypothetical protein
MQLRRFWSVAACAGLVLGTMGRADAILTFYVNRAAFDAANPGLPIEGFQNANTGTAAFTGPLDMNSNNASFSPGDILPGITFQDNPGPDAGAMFVAGPGQSTNPTTAIGQNFPASDAMDILLNPGVNAVAFDIFQNFGGGSQSGVTQPYPVNIFGASGLLGSTIVLVATGQSGFFGVSSDVPGEIVRVSLNHAGAFDVIDNVAFGASRQDVPEPSTLAFAGAMGIGLLALGRSRLRRKN